MLEDYINRLDDVCGDEREFIVTLKSSKQKEALHTILEKCRIKQDLSGMLVRATYKDKDLSIFRTGKLVVKEFNGKEDVQNFLEELLELG